jgi:hypothetical protein
MKHLKSSLKDLRRVFDEAITVREIAEPLVSFDASHGCESVRRFMEQRGFDVVGAREHGTTVGFVRRNDLAGETIREHLARFDEGDALPENSSILDVIRSLETREAVFVNFLGHVGGIVTRGDLQKAPVRMWLFGLVSMVEMQMLRVLQEALDEDEWSCLLSGSRLDKAREMFRDRSRRNEETTLADCLQWGDKATIFLKKGRLRSVLGLASKREVNRVLDQIQDLRNDLAHSQDIVKGRWPELAKIALSAERLLENLEATSFDSRNFAPED